MSKRNGVKVLVWQDIFSRMARGEVAKVEPTVSDCMPQGPGTAGRRVQVNGHEAVLTQGTKNDPRTFTSLDGCSVAFSSLDDAVAAVALYLSEYV